MLIVNLLWNRCMERTKRIFLCFMEEITASGFGTSWGRIITDRIFIFESNLISWLNCADIVSTSVFIQMHFQTFIWMSQSLLLLPRVHFEPTTPLAAINPSVSASPLWYPQSITFLRTWFDALITSSCGGQMKDKHSQLWRHERKRGNHTL